MDPNNPLADQTGLEPKVSTSGQFWTVFWLCLILGVLGAHRFYARRYHTAILQFVTCGGLAVWTTYDLIKIVAGDFQDEDGMVYRTRRMGLPLLIFMGVIALGFFGHTDIYKRWHYRMERQEQLQRELDSLGPSITGTNTAVQQLITTYAQGKFGKNIAVSIEGPETNGIYQVTLHERVGAGIQNTLYNVTLDAAGKKVATWQ